MTIIALSGKKRVGKNVFGDVLVKKYGFQQIAIADPLRNLCGRVFYLDYTNDALKDERIQRIYIDFHDVDNIRKIVENEWGYEITEDARNALEELHGVGIDTPRDALRIVGNALREHVSENIWIELCAHKIKALGGRVVITDARFENEREFFRQIGAITVLIKRNDNGDSKEHEFDLGFENEYDAVFTNDATLHEYISSVDMWYNSKKNEFELYRVWKYE